jgi:hypothetical protein
MNTNRHEFAGVERVLSFSWRESDSCSFPGEPRLLYRSCVNVQDATLLNPEAGVDDVDDPWLS